jgi:hypothetical protein
VAVGFGVLSSFSATLFGVSPVSIAVLEDTLVTMPCRSFLGSRKWGLLTVSGILLMGEHGITRAKLRHAPNRRALRQNYLNTYAPAGSGTKLGVPVTDSDLGERWVLRHLA